MKHRRRFFLWCLALPALVNSACSCSTESALQQILSISIEPPVFISCNAVSAREIAFRFSLPVTVSSLIFDPPQEISEIQEGDIVRVILQDPPPGGERIMADILVEDRNGNTVNVLIPFRSRNEFFPSFIITEIRTEYSKPKVEFVELKMLTAGNLGALRMFSASTGLDTPIFEFPPAPVNAGEYVVIHLRTLDPAVANETGGDRGAVLYTKENEAQPDAWDFWIPDSKKRISKKSGAVFFTDQDDHIIDAVVFSESTGGAVWQDEKMARAAELLGKAGAWPAADGGVPGPGDAVLSRDATVTRSICRNETAADRDNAADWYITATSGASPGKPNNTKRYVPSK
ncbi:MAG: hypothetical protein LBH70_10600 [Spirochaetaceae bacterium]|jgi:hypothetical protein|nr:hypothetical protein [Spirochaetaceae bacterium]